MSKSYDFKLVEFPNGSIELRVYDKPISDLDEKENERRQVKRANTISQRVALANPKSDEYIPFEDKVIEVSDINRLEDFEYSEELRKRKNARDSYRRTVNKIHDLARCEKWTMFYTLTFSPAVADRTDFSFCMGKARKWFDNLRQRKAHDLKYLLIPELHADKCSWHIHGLVCNDNGISYVDSGKRDKHGKIIYNVENYKLGWSTATRIDDTQKVSSYVLKYITKDLCERSLGQRRYFRSNNLQKPVVTELLSSEVFEDGYIYDLDNIEIILNSLGCDEITRIKKVSAEHCSVTYINAN